MRPERALLLKSAARAQQGRSCRRSPETWTYVPALCVLLAFNPTCSFGRKDHCPWTKAVERICALTPVDKDVSNNGSPSYQSFAITAAWTGEKEFALGKQLEAGSCSLPQAHKILESKRCLKAPLSPSGYPLSRGDPRFEKKIVECCAAEGNASRFQRSERPEFLRRTEAASTYKVAVAYAIVRLAAHSQVATQIFPFLELPNWQGPNGRPSPGPHSVFRLAVVCSWAFRDDRPDELSSRKGHRFAESTKRRQTARAQTHDGAITSSAALAAGVTNLRFCAFGAGNTPRKAALNSCSQNNTTTIRSLVAGPFANLSE